MSFLYGGLGPVLPSILPVSALKESDSTVDNGSMFSTTYLPIIVQSVSQVFGKLEQKNPALAAC